MLWEKALEAEPEFFFEDDPDPYYFLGVCYYQLEEYDIAKVYLHSVVYNWPDERQGKHAEAFIEIIESRQGKLQ